MGLESSDVVRTLVDTNLHRFSDALGLVYNYFI